MKNFAKFIDIWEQSSSYKLSNLALENYLRECKEDEIIYAIALLTGKVPKRICSSKTLQIWFEELKLIPSWLFEESKSMVGDLTETLALLIPNENNKNLNSKGLKYWINQILLLKNEEEKKQKIKLVESWNDLGLKERILFNKLITGTFKKVYPTTELAKIIATIYKKNFYSIIQKIESNWNPTTDSFSNIFLLQIELEDNSFPIPFSKLENFEFKEDKLPNPLDCYVYYAISGIRVQLVISNKQINIWSEKNELITGKFPEFSSIASTFPDQTIIEGYLISRQIKGKEKVDLIKSRLSKKSITQKQVKESPVQFILSDVLKFEGSFLLNLAYQKRLKVGYEIQNKFINKENFLTVIPILNCTNLVELKTLRINARNYNSSSVILIKKDSIYSDIKIVWPCPKLSFKAVLLYYTTNLGEIVELTFAVKNQLDFITVTKTKVDLNSSELVLLNKFVKDNTRERFGPVRSLKPELVFEINCDSILFSKRHKSGIVLENPKINKWLKNCSLEDVIQLEELKKLN